MRMVERPLARRGGSIAYAGHAAGHPLATLRRASSMARRAYRTVGTVIIPAATAARSVSTRTRSSAGSIARLRLSHT